MTQTFINCSGARSLTCTKIQGLGWYKRHFLGYRQSFCGLKRGRGSRLSPGKWDAAEMSLSPWGLGMIWPGSCWQLFWYRPVTWMIWGGWGNNTCSKVIKSHQRQKILVHLLLAMPASCSPPGGAGCCWGAPPPGPPWFSPLVPCHLGPYWENS